MAGGMIPRFHSVELIKMQLSHSFSEIPEDRFSQTLPKVGRSKLNVSSSEESPYNQKIELAKKKKSHRKELKATRSGAVAMSADQAGMGLREGELPQIGSYWPMKRPERQQWSPEQLKYIDKYFPLSLESAMKGKIALISDLQFDLLKYKAELRQIQDESESGGPQELEKHSYASAQHLKLLEKTIEQSKRLKEITSENKRLLTRVKELERLFLNAKTKLDQSEARASRLHKELTQLREKQQETTAVNEYYRVMKMKAIHFVGEMTKPQTEKREVNLRFMELDDAHMPVLVDILKQCPYAETIDLEGNKITDFGVSVLSQYLKSFHCRVAYVNLDWNEVDVEGAWSLVEAIMGRDYEIENNIAKVSQLEPPQKIARISISYNRMTSHTALIRKVMEYLKRTQKETLVQLNVTKKALTRVSAKTVSQAFHAVSQTFAELADIKSLTAVLDRIRIEQNEMNEGQMESRKVEERASAIRDFQVQLARLEEMHEASEKEALFASVLQKEERLLRRRR